MKHQAKIIALLNAYTHGKSGGDVAFIEIYKRDNKYKKIIITSFLGKILCQKSGLKGNFIQTSWERKFNQILLTYLKRTIKALFFKIVVNKKDVILSTSDALPDVLPAFKLKLKNPKAKWVQHIFHLIPAKRKTSFLAQKLSFILIKRFADLIIVDNKILKTNLVSLGFNNQKVAVNGLGINFKYLKAFQKTKKTLTASFMGQLRPSKGIFDLITIWGFVCQEIPKAKLAIIGSGNKKIINKLKKKIKYLSLEKNIKIIGFVSDKIAFETIKSSKIFVFPSLEEGFGLAALEAQALGLPVIAWNLPAFKEIFLKGMVKIKTGNFKQFSQQIIKLLKNSHYYQKLSWQALKNASLYDWNKVAKNELNLIKNLELK